MKLAERHIKTNSHSSRSGMKGNNMPFFQPKLTIGTPGDRYEQEADSMADHIMMLSKESNGSFFSTDDSSRFISGNVNPVQHKIQRVTEEEAEMQMQPMEDLEAAEMMNGAADGLVQTKSETEENTTNNSSTATTHVTVDNTPQVQKEEDIENDEFEELQENPVQAKSETVDTPSDNFESTLSSSKGSGSPLSSDIKPAMESGFGTDFGNVRIHTGSDAVQMSNEIGAQAFTHGSDIYFNEGRYNPSTELGQHLIAHELTHTIQQGASIQGKMVQKQDAENVDNTTKIEDIEPSSDGKMNETSEGIKMELENFRVKENVNQSWMELPLKLPLSGSRATKQISVWRKNVRPLVVNKIESMASSVDTESNKYTLSLKKNTDISFTGTRSQIANEIFIPNWDNQGDLNTYQVEHLIDWQLAGGGVNVDNIDNLILLDAQTNNALGQTVLQLKNSHIRRLLEHYKEAGVTQDPSVAANSFEILINSIKPDIAVNGSIYEKKDFESEDKNPLRSQLLELKNFEVPQGSFLLKTSNRGGSYIIPYSANGYETGSFKITVLQKEREEENETKRSITKITLDPIVAPNSVRKKESSEYDVIELGTDEYMARGLKSRLRNIFELEMLSPVELQEDQFEILGGMNIYAVGKVAPTVPIIKDADIELVIEGREVRLRKLFNFGEIDVPAPFEITDSGIEIFIGSGGFGASGMLNFAIRNVGRGHLEASVTTSGGFALAGAFNFDSQLFDPAQIRAEYKDNEWTIGGTIGIPQGKIRGVKNATITAEFSGNSFTASGDAELDIPGIERGTMEASYNDDGFSIGGEFQLRNDIPGIRGGSVSANVSKTGDEGYKVMVSGTAQPDIPGINSSLSVSYDDGAITIEGSAAYARGMLSGTVNVGATNRPVGEDGQPAGEPDGTMRVYGGGSLTLRLTPWLQATAGVKFLPNGEIEITGRIGLPSVVDVFNRKSIEKNLFRAPTVEIPIFAIPLGPRSIGIVARITGGLDFSAGFGPGQLRDLYAEVTYNPDREEDTTIVGHGLFVIPADAGLTLRGDLGLGVSIAIASLSGGIELAGTLGLEGEAAAEVDVNWSPRTGITLDAEGRIIVNPKFVFDLNAFARASLDLWLVSFSETWRYNMVSFSWGPDIQFGIVFPVHYSEEEPFDMSFDDIRVIYPDIDVVNMAIDLSRSIKNKIFD